MKAAHRRNDIRRGNCLTRRQTRNLWRYRDGMFASLPWAQGRLRQSVMPKRGYRIYIDGVARASF